MRGWRHITAFALVLGMTASTAFGSYTAAVPGQAEPAGLKWRQGSIKLSISRSVVEPNSNIKYDSDVMGAIQRSISAWQQAAEIKIEYDISDRASVSPSGFAGDGVSLLTIAQTPENLQLFNRDPFAESARTRVFYNRRNEITEADIVLNPFQQFSTDSTFGTFDLEATLTHEIGHLLGLRHTSVLGATMSGSLPKNGTLGRSDLAGRSLDEADISAVRDLYGVSESTEACCGALVGKLTTQLNGTLKGSRVWAEESETGRVVALTTLDADGTFRLGGLRSGSYSIFSVRDGDPFSTSLVHVGAYRLEEGETRVINERIAVQRHDVMLNYVGVDSQLSDFAVSVAPGTENSIFLGGRDLEAGKTVIEFNSPFISVIPRSISEEDFGEGVSVLNFRIAVHPDTPAGVYSIFATDKDGNMAALIGAVNVQEN